MKLIFFYCWSLGSIYLYFARNSCWGKTCLQHNVLTCISHNRDVCTLFEITQTSPVSTQCYSKHSGQMASRNCLHLNFESFGLFGRASGLAPTRWLYLVRGCFARTLRSITTTFGYVFAGISSHPWLAVSVLWPIQFWVCTSWSALQLVAGAFAIETMQGRMKVQHCI